MLPKSKYLDSCLPYIYFALYKSNGYYFIHSPIHDLFIQ